MNLTYALISRIEEIALGTLCSSMVHAFLFPISMRSLLEQSVTQWYLNACKVCTICYLRFMAEKKLGAMRF